MKNTTTNHLVILAFAAMLVLTLSACSPAANYGTTPGASGTGATPPAPAPSAPAATPTPSAPAPSGTPSTPAATETPPAPAQPPAPSTPPAALSGKGSLSITTAPGNAIVYVNDVNKGTSPIVVNDLPYGFYVVRATKLGYVDNTFNTSLNVSLAYVLVNLTDTATYAKNLANKDQPGTVFFRSSPSNAEVTVDGAFAGVTPFNDRNMTAGIHHFVIKKATYMDYTGAIEVLGGQTVTINPNLVSQ